MLFFAAFAGCKHISQFNESLKKAYYRASRAFMRQKLRLYQAPKIIGGPMTYDDLEKDQLKDGDEDI